MYLYYVPISLLIWHTMIKRPHIHFQYEDIYEAFHYAMNAAKVVTT